MPDVPIACTLTPAELRDRQAAWHKLGSHVKASAPIPGGIAVTFAPVPGLQDSLGQLVRLEAECCAWMTFAIEDQPDGIRMLVKADGEDGERGVRETFALLTGR